MSQVTISDFVIALCELAEAESRSLQKSVQIFLASERQALSQTILDSSWMIALIGAAVFCLLVALGFITWGGYILCVDYISPIYAPFIMGGAWLLFALVFALLAFRRGAGGK
jgi:fatty acid desaturase